jgi:hypothetical protein
MKPDSQQAMQRADPVPKQNRPAWFKSVSLGLGFVCLVLILNTSLLGAVLRRPDIGDGATVMFTGSCDRSSAIITAVELMINVVSTILFAVSNNCIQLLLSPTRDDVDRVHAGGNWMHIGISSSRNLRWIPLWRILICIALFISSVPLHLL